MPAARHAGALAPSVAAASSIIPLAPMDSPDARPSRRREPDLIVPCDDLAARAGGPQAQGDALPSAGWNF